MKQLYMKITLALVLIVICSFNGFSQEKSPLWTKTTTSKITALEPVFRKTEPNISSFYQLDLEALKTKLQYAPQRSDSNGTSTVTVDFPTINGKFESFKVMEASVMDPSLQAQFPEIRSYVGQSIHNPSNLMRFSITPQGLNTMLMTSNEGTQFIDPYTKTGNFYILYSKRDLPKLDEPFLCGFVNDEELSKTVDFDLEAARNANDGKLRTYELALACTVEYSSFQINAANVQSGTTAQKKAAVLAAMNVTMTRVNGIYEKDFSLTMVLIPNNLSIIFVGTDNFNNNNPDVLINQSQSVIDQIIGSANYDIGHTFSTGGGGLAGLNVPCISGQKARGITGLFAPVGDSYDIDFVAHEMGHQFGSNHTFNGNAGSCAGGNRSSSNAYEPGSGSTIMAYAGICSPQDVQSNSDDYFHQRSIVTIWANISAGNSSSCSTNTTTNNAAPTAEAGANYTIPVGTPYKLVGASTDTDGIGSHTYTWEQYDLGPAGLPTETRASGPLVRSFKGTTNPTRYIPKLQDLLYTAGSTTWEKLATVSRPINYKLTVRDNDSRGGQTAADNMTATTVAAAGPFSVTSQATEGISWVQNTTETITWNVAGTTANGVNTANVNILLSTDGGLTYPTVLASNTPNDGSQAITVPNIQQPYCRVMVEGAGNIFFNINSQNFAIGVTVLTTCESYTTTNTNFPIPDGGNSYSGIPVSSNSFRVLGGDVFARVNVDITHPYIGDLFLAIQSPDGPLLPLVQQPCGNNENLNLTFVDNAGGLVCENPTIGKVKPLQSLSTYDGQFAGGQWVLGVVDVSAQDIGVVNSWTLDICSRTVTPLSIAENDLIGFSIFPNPNKGEFTIKMKTTSNEAVKVQVYDIRGRLVYDNLYDSSPEFNQLIKLNNVQAGMYLVKINDGEKQATKKIIVE